MNNIIITPEEYRGTATSFVEQNGGFIIVASDISPYQTQTSSDTDVSSITSDAVEGFKIVDCYSKNEEDIRNGFYKFYKIESVFSKIGVMIEPSVYIASFSELTETLNRENYFNVWVIKDGKIKFIPKP